MTEIAAMMTAARLHGIEDLRLDQVPVQMPGLGELLVRVHACCLCGSDLRIYRHGNERVVYPAIIGHEMAGVVAAVGEDCSDWQVGDRLAVGADVPSMQDDWSKQGMGNLADINYAIGYQFPGGFAEYCLLNRLTVQFGPVAKIPEHLSYEQAALAEPLACCINGLERGRLSPGGNVMIFGAGPIGLLLAMTAGAFGAGRVVLADVDRHRVEQARSLSVGDVVHLCGQSASELIAPYDFKRGGFDLVLTACPSHQAQQTALEVVAKRGVVNLFGGLPKGAPAIALDSNAIHYKEAMVTGSHGSNPRQHGLALAMIASGRVDVGQFITHRFSLADIDQALDTAAERKGLKVVICPQGITG